MKRTILFLTLLLTASLAAVQAKTIVVYYSYTGNCKAIANALTSQITADMLEIQPAEKGLRYEANNYALGTQLLNAIKANPNAASSYPAIDPVNVSLGDYQNVIIITPLWWSQMAAPMQTFLFSYGAASRYSGLYILGKATQGAASISRLTGTIRVEAVGGTSGIHSTKAGSTSDASHGYALNGMIASEGRKGVVIKDGKKIIVKR